MQARKLCRAGGDLSFGVARRVERLPESIRLAPDEPIMKRKVGYFLMLVVAFLLGGAAGRYPGKASGGHRPVPQDDAALVKSLLGEQLSDRTFDFTTIAETCSGRRVGALACHHRHQSRAGGNTDGSQQGGFTR
jgi:hypothetical protein